MRKMAGDDTTDAFQYAVKLLARRDYSVAALRKKLESRFGDVAESVLQMLIAKRFVDDKRYAENFVARRTNWGAERLRETLAGRGIEPEIVEQVLSSVECPSLRDALNAKMIGWSLRRPLQSRDAARLFRALARLGYEEDAIREEIQNLDEQ